jgi:metal-responsive CopG/Arc/MetJ family transcriptional regulator
MKSEENIVRAIPINIPTDKLEKIDQIKEKRKRSRNFILMEMIDKGIEEQYEKLEELEVD